VKRAHRRLFDEIDWSTCRVFEQTKRRAAELDLSVTILQPWYDVDDAEGLRRLRTDLAADDVGLSAADPYKAPHTRAALTCLGPHLESALRATALPQAEP